MEQTKQSLTETQKPYKEYTSLLINFEKLLFKKDNKRA